MPRHDGPGLLPPVRHSAAQLALGGPISWDAAFRTGESDDASDGADSRAKLLWARDALLVATLSAALWFGLRTAYFPAGVRDGTSQCNEFIATEGRATMDWIIASAPVWARDALLAAFGWWACRKAGGVEGQGLTTAIIGGGVGADDGAAGSAGWLAIVGGHEERRAQPTWAEARDARGMKQRTALWLGSVKVVFWHWPQPAAYIWLLMSYRCFVAELGPTQQNLAAVVAAREVLYLFSTLLACALCPVYLLLDLRTVWNEAAGPLQKGTRLTMYLLCPHNYVALCLANRFPLWQRVFFCLAGVQVVADLSSGYALAALLAGGIEITDSDPGVPEYAGAHPLAIGYGITAFGFLFFFGPLSIVTSFEGAWDAQRHKLLRFARGFAGAALLCAWLVVVGALGWLIGGGNPFCGLSNPCNGNGLGDHGGCYAAAQCHCKPGYGPESKLSGDPLCLCPVGWTGANCDRCEEGYIGEHCTATFVISGVTTLTGSARAVANGRYEKTEHVCHNKPTYQMGATGHVLHYYHDKESKVNSWYVGPSERATDCGISGAPLLYGGAPLLYGGAPLESPDGSGCVGKWAEQEWVQSGRGPGSSHAYLVGNPSVKVVAAGGLGCVTAPLDCNGHGVCVGRSVGQPFESRSCACDSGWSGDNCEHKPCDGDPCGSHGISCQTDPWSVNAIGHTCACKGGWCAIDDCNVTGIGDNHACAFNVSGIYASRAGIYVKTNHICNGKPVYQKSNGDVLLRYGSSTGSWRISDRSAATNCVGHPSGASWVISQGNCPASPDGVGCVGKWIKYGRPHWTTDPNITVKAV